MTQIMRRMIEIKKKRRLSGDYFVIDGGDGSGNFGHSGRPGEVGGSSPNGGGGGSGGSGGAGKNATTHINSLMGGGLQERKSKLPEATKTIADMPQGSVITGITDAGRRRDYVKGPHDTWKAKYQNTYNAKEELMDSASVASTLLNMDDYNFGQTVSVEEKTERSNRERRGKKERWKIQTGNRDELAGVHFAGSSKIKTGVNC